MTEHEDQLREAFQTHESLAPDPAAVYARVQELARTYRRRRRGAQAAGGAVLGAGLIAGAINLPALLSGPPQHAVSVMAPGATTVSPSPSPTSSPSKEDVERWQAAYFKAGYDYDNAVELARLWHREKDNIGAVKAEAGRRLMAGETLPVKPGGTPATDAPDSEEAQRVGAFFDAGYDYADAVTLAKLWKLDETYAAKVEGGRRLLAGETLPIRATPDDNQDGDSTPLNTYFAAGYDYDDAVKLAKLWKLDSPYDAKVLAGKKLQDGETLPIKP